MPTTLTAELYFEDPAQRIYHLKFPAPRLAQPRVCLTDQDGIATPPHATLTLEHQGIPENAAFSVRFTSDLPVVLSHKDHVPDHKV